MAHAATLTHVVLRRPVVPWLVRDAGSAIVAGLDGLLIGLTAGYLALTAVGAPANQVGLPASVAVVVVGLAVTTVAGLGALAAIAFVRLLGLVGVVLTLPLGARGHGRTARAIGTPFRWIDGLPAGWVGAFVILLWIALVGSTLGPLGLLTPPGILSPFVYVVGLVGVLAGMARSISRPTRDRLPIAAGRVRRMVAGVVALAAAGVVVAAAAFAAWPGSTDGLVPNDPVFDGDPAVVAAAAVDLGAADLADPGQAGPYAVEQHSYGSGTDARRPRFGADADLITPTVDAAAILPPLDGGADAWRAAWWGFGTDTLPLDGLVWSPIGEGPFPLVLIVHGNHAMGDFSEDGYAYLGEHLASRGFITVSVDEDFLNGSWVGEWHGQEQLARAWLLLLHLDQWRTWDAEAGNPFEGRVDLDRVALIGHSRGGEASSVAAMIAGGVRAPDASMTPWPTGLDIDAVVSIAPSDGQYVGGVRLDGVDFLTIQGGHDADARAWSGIRQYARTDVGDDGFKAGLWTYRANHGQFNSVWGRGDFGPFSPVMLNLAPLLTAEEQQDVARTAIGAFLEASLRDQAGYRRFFARPMAGRAWLPDDIVLVRSNQGGTTALTGGSSRTPIDGVTVVTEGFASVDAMDVPLKALQSDQLARATMARWDAGSGDAMWGVDIAPGAVPSTTASTTLRFALADGSGTDLGSTTPISLAAEVTDRDGTTVELPLAAVGALPPPLPVQLAKDDRSMAMTGIDLTLVSPVERVLQTYAIPLSSFEAADPAFDAADLAAFRLRIDRAAPGGIWIADVGLGD